MLNNQINTFPNINNMNLFISYNPNIFSQNFIIGNNQIYQNNYFNYFPRNQQNSFINSEERNNLLNFNYINIPIKRKTTEQPKRLNNIFYNDKSDKKSSFNITTKKINKLDSYETDEINQFIEYLNSLPPLIEYLRTQKGTKELKKVIIKNNPLCISILINTLQSNLSLLMIDLYGNYFCQFIIKLCNHYQIILILTYIKNDYVTIAKHYSGTHVLQTLCDVITTQEEEKLILSCIENNEIEMAYDSNATHVLQKIISTINEIRRDNLNKIILANLRDFSLDVNGICVVKKFISYNILNTIKNQIILIISENCIEISQSPFGNYAIQFILENWKTDCQSIINIIVKNICYLGLQKYSSNVTEKIIGLLNEEQINSLINELFYSNKIMNFLKNKYGKYVVKKIIPILNDKQKEDISNFLSNLKVSNSKDRNKLKNFILNFRK